jgi:hypothetical protein
MDRSMILPVFTCYSEAVLWWISQRWSLGGEVNDSTCFSLVEMDGQLDGKQEIVDQVVQVNESDCFSLVGMKQFSTDSSRTELLMERSMNLTVSGWMLLSVWLMD